VKAIVLAAGRGKRLRPLTNSIPKPLVKLGGKALIDHILDALSSLDVDEVVVVGGYLAEKLGRHIEAWGEWVHFVENERFESGNLLSLMAAFDQVEGDILLMNSDHIYPLELLSRFTDETPEEIRIACDSDRELKVDDMKVLLDDDGRLKEIGKELREYSVGYIGMTFVAASKIPRYKQIVCETHQNLGDDADVEAVLRRLAVSGNPPVAVDLSGFVWFEVDTMEELEEAGRKLSAGAGTRNEPLF